ncbi:MAG: dihydrolipoamide acetyltransferase family protein [Bacteroidales bacterium]
MAEAVSMPRQGQSVETCIITQWFKQKGEKVEEGDLLFAYETDKAAFEEEAKVSGILLDVFFEEGDEVPVLTNVAVIGMKGESTGEFKPGTATEEKPEKMQEKAENGPKDTVRSDKAFQHVEGSPEEDRIKISPRARAMARDMNINPSEIKGSGPNGRIIVRDIESYPGKSTIPSEAPLSEKDYSGYSEKVEGTTDKAISNIRRIIADNMQASLRNSAQLTHHMSADARKILALRKDIKQRMETDRLENITLNDMVCFAVVQVLRKFPYMNAQFLGDKIREFRKVNLGMAVDTERGLMVPVLMNADDYSLSGLSGKLKTLANDCKTGKIDPELLKSSKGSFTISNLGGYGIEMFTPVLNIPQVGILGVNTINYQPRDLGDGGIGLIPVIGLSLTYDHRAVDGAPASAFLKELAGFIADFNAEF